MVEGGTDTERSVTSFYLLNAFASDRGLWLY